MNLKSVVTVAVLATATTCTAPSRGLAWQFTSLGGSDYGFSAPAVSGRDVAYTYYGGPSGASIGVHHVYGNGSIGSTSIVRTGDPAPSGVFTGLGPARISDGTVAFSASYTGGASVFTKSGGMPAVLSKRNSA